MSADIGSGIEALRPWVSTGILAAILLVVSRIVGPAKDYLVRMRELKLEEKKDDRLSIETIAATLREELKQCRESCEEADKRAKEEHARLQEEMFGLRKQHLAEQISLINVIISSVDAPELRTLLKTLESVQAHVSLRQKVEGA